MGKKNAPCEFTFHKEQNPEARINTGFGVAPPTWVEQVTSP